MMMCHEDASNPRMSSGIANGFTLIELSIVLVIIGLLVGGVLTGKDLVRAAEVRATLSQIEKYNTAANTFRGKYGELPGDMDNTTALQFGFMSRAGTAGMGDGNGVVEGFTTVADGFAENCEPLLFWQDLSVGNPSTPISVNLIDGSFNTVPVGGCNNATAGVAVNTLFPPAKIGKGNYIYVFSTLGVNYFGVEAISGISNSGTISGSADLTAQQAYQMDKKVDDGMPQTGNVIATYINAAVAEDTPINTSSILSSHANSPAATTDCYDSATLAYAVGVNNGGTKGTCAVSFEFN